jgi:8-oxo-dGTP pyrophosphatase MutT (NUDIX family)
VSASTDNGPAAPQIIPRPPSSEPGPPAPWEALAPQDRAGLSIERVRAALEGPIDLDARPPLEHESAVLAALFDEAGESRIVLTRRAATLRSHRSEVSFPGGRVEPGETLIEAALREAHEEVALDPRSVRVIGTLTPLQTFSSRAFIRPFIGILPQRPTLRANPFEVERAFDVALADLIAPGVYRSERWGMGDVARLMHFFDLPGDIVWGATGRLLWELLARVTGTMPATGVDDQPLP